MKQHITIVRIIFAAVSILCSSPSLNAMRLPAHLRPSPLTLSTDFFDDPSLPTEERAARSELFNAFAQYKQEEIIAWCSAVDVTRPLQIDGSTPLMMAVSMVNGPIMDAIFSSLTDATPAMIQAYIGLSNSSGETALSLAACSDCSDVIAYLMQFPVAPLTIIHAIAQAAFCLKSDSIKTLLRTSRYSIIDLHQHIVRAIVAANIPASVSNQTALDCFSTAYGIVIREQLRIIIAKQNANKRHDKNSDGSASAGAGSGKMIC